MSKPRILRILGQAADNFRPDNGTKFETFITPHIDGAIKDELRDENPLSRGDQKRAKAWKDTEYRLAQQLQRTPSSAEVAAALGVDLKEADRMRLLASEVREVSLDQISSSTGGEIWDAPSDFREPISDPRYDQATLDDHVIFVEKVELVEQTISRLEKPEQERQILLGATACRPLDEIAKEYGVTASRISQRVNSTRREIRKNLNEYDAAA